MFRLLRSEKRSRSLQVQSRNESESRKSDFAYIRSRLGESETFNLNKTFTILQKRNRTNSASFFMETYYEKIKDKLKSYQRTTCNFSEPMATFGRTLTRALRTQEHTDQICQSFD